MKKITLLAAVILVASFASCKKIRTCKCTYNDGAGNTSTYTATSTVKLSKKDAKTWCEGSSTNSCTLEN